MPDENGGIPGSTLGGISGGAFSSTLGGISSGTSSRTVGGIPGGASSSRTLGSLSQQQPPAHSGHIARPRKASLAPHHPASS
ncbi:hypothetical protein QS306_00890 [Paraburkholderia bonniea]|nr:hypothetical protein [Paraburkholderia bonniea]WJF90278.1 hypothetical protein QS306_00890 [Paraburkholderia bonniea]